MFFKSTIELSAAWRAKVAWAAVATSALILPVGGLATIPKANISVRTRRTASLRRLMPRCHRSTASRSFSHRGRLHDRHPGHERGYRGFDGVEVRAHEPW